MDDYAAVYRRSLEAPEEFWAEAARSLAWDRPPRQVLDGAGAPYHRWFPDGWLNTCYNAVDRHVESGCADRVALLYDSPVTGVKRSHTYAELRDQVARFAGVLRGLGVRRGDRVVLYMPMVPQAVITMLACARIGAVHSVVFGGFAARELATRIADARPKVVVYGSCGVEPQRIVPYQPVLDEALRSLRLRPRVVVLQRPQCRAEVRPGELDWEAAVAAAQAVDCVPLPATDPLYVLYTSGTTGGPKGVVRDNGGHAVALAWSMRHVYDIEGGQVWWAASDIGWVVGHSYVVYAPLLVGATTVIYEGKPVGTPDAGALWRVVAEHGVAGMFAAPTALRAVRQADPAGRLARSRDLTSLRNLFVAGERLDPATHRWASDLLRVPVVDHWWQTETGWPICAGLRGLGDRPLKPGSPGLAVPGFDVRILDDHGNPAAPGSEGAICLRPPLPPGTLTGVWGEERRYVEAAPHPCAGHYLTGDSGYVDDEGYVYVMGRTDDVINVAGHRLSTGAMEAAVGAHPDVAECAVIGVRDELKGQVPRALVVLKAGATEDLGRLRADLVTRVREHVGPIASLKRVDVVNRLPKTRSGKILRRAMRGIADGREEPVPATIEDPEVLENLRSILWSS
ncbi:propionyl-CoA synthetase [Streptomyces chumphonensis]|uniref:AMP-binding protein n=1 Tax=Streptomyces chumphonensis TaxID=1214925 RepID=UPI002963FFF6|nr:AMP-binding protein [Streptomyces chumphonensis]